MIFLRPFRLLPRNADSAQTVYPRIRSGTGPTSGMAIPCTRWQQQLLQLQGLQQPLEREILVGQERCDSWDIRKNNFRKLKKLFRNIVLAHATRLLCLWNAVYFSQYVKCWPSSSFHKSFRSSTNGYLRFSFTYLRECVVGQSLIARRFLLCRRNSQVNVSRLPLLSLVFVRTDVYSGILQSFAYVHISFVQRLLLLLKSSSLTTLKIFKESQSIVRTLY